MGFLGRICERTPVHSVYNGDYKQTTSASRFSPLTQGGTAFQCTEKQILFPALPEITLFNFTAELLEKERQSGKCLLFKVIVGDFTEEQEQAFHKTANSRDRAKIPSWRLRE